MIKRLLGAAFVAFEYVCVATVLAQLVLLAVIYLKNGLTPDKRWRISAIIAGVDINELYAKASEDKANQGLLGGELANRGLIVEQREGQVKEDLGRLEVVRAGLRLERQRYEILRREFASRLDSTEASAMTGSRQDLQEIFEAMDTKLAREQMLAMITDGGLEDVVEILGTMADTQKAKILAEFVQPGDAVIVHDILMRLRDKQNEASLAGTGG